MNNWFQKQWSAFTLWHILLIPLSWIFFAVIYVRKLLYSIGWLKIIHLNVPVIVVGNISVGGTGKTPLVIWLAEQLQLAGFKPGIISRGYGGTSRQATAVFSYSNPQQVGDEPVLIVKRTACPMFIGADRVSAGQALLQANPQCNVIISDDGLQHYRLHRDVELALLDSSRKFGNQFLLPAGPLREKITRLQSVDAIIDSGTPSDFDFYLKDLLPPVFNMELQGIFFEPVNVMHADGFEAKQPPSYFMHKNLVAIAGIGNPERFFNHLSGLGLQFERKAYADHHAFSAQDFVQIADKTILMTEKDAVKCQSIDTKDTWYLPVNALVSSQARTSLIELILQKLRN